MTASSPSTLIIGAGLSGLIAARDLAAAGRSVLVVDKGRSVGGRLATRRMGAAVLDHGAQFFTVRSDEFRTDVDQWIADGVIEEWCRGFGAEDGYPRYRTAGGMNQLAKHLSRSLETFTEDGSPLVQMELRQRAAAIIPTGDTYAISYDGATREPDEVTSVIITSPVPQTLEVLNSGGVAMTAEARTAIESIRYHAVVGLLATVDASPDFGPAGAKQQPDDETFSFIADNAVKGISPEPAVTFHASHQRSAELWDSTDAEILAALRPEAERELGGVAITDVQVKKWRYAGPVEPYPERCLVASSSPGPLVLAGDAFGGPKVEGAYLSGRAGAAAVLA